MMLINELSSSDAKEAKNFVLRCLKNFGFLYDKRYHFDLDEPKKYYPEAGGVFYLLKLNNEIIGTIAVLRKGKTAELKRFYIADKQQKKGYGSKLFEKALDFCKKNKLQKIKIVTDRCFKTALVFYLKRGCKILKQDAKKFYLEKKI